MAAWHLPWKPLAFAIMPLEFCVIYGHKWPAHFPFGAAVPLRDFSVNIVCGDSPGATWLLLRSLCNNTTILYSLKYTIQTLSHDNY